MGKLKMAAITLVLVAAVQLAAAETVFVQSVQTKIWAAPRFDAAVLAVVRRGDALSVLEEERRWIKVRGAEAQGWVPRLVVGARPPLDEASVLTGGAPVQRARRRASAASPAAAARGLMADSRQRAEDQADADYLALQEVESIQITEAELRSFLQPLDQP